LATAENFHLPEEYYKINKLIVKDMSAALNVVD